ncbi:MAG: 2-dehydro-3-deoxygalactonokinase [Clostridia bacterium]|nr:2-dehydro-3-deoxygalactonokinase [Clostridia bacterium]
MKKYITVDGGTTNTRVNLNDQKNIFYTVKIQSGARVNSAESYKIQIKKAIEEILLKNKLTESDIECIVASGMITSERGLYEVKHVQAPAGIKELHDNIQHIYLRDITSIPFAFIPGVRTSADSVDTADVMRGEESEIIGIANYENSLCVLCGSHTKFIKTDTNGRITEFSTTLTGEMISALSSETILNDAVNLDITETDSEYLLKGYDYSCENGLNKALFKVRVLKNIFNASDIKIYSFYIGAILAGDISEIINYNISDVIVGGRENIKKAVAKILKNRTKVNVTELDNKTVQQSNAFGMVKIYRED